jgi:transcriptional regulator GlxA family with amidase domain
MPPRAPRRIAIVVFDGLQPLDLTGPHEVFSAANQEEVQAGRPRPYRIQVVARAPGPKRSTSGLSVIAEHPLPQEPVDTILIVGGEGSQDAGRDEALLAWLRAASSAARRTCSVCSGAFVLAAAGLLDGRRATTHWSRAAELAREYPAVQVDPEPLFIQDGRVWTSGGVTAGIDLALALVEADLGTVTAQAIARQLVLFLRRSGGQSQFSSEVWTDPPEREALRELVHHIHARPGSDLSLPTLALRASMSVRHLQRTFTRELGEPPSGYVTRVRVEAARRVLELQPTTVVSAARQCGFGTAEAMRRAFQRHLGISPDAYRDRFRSSRSPDLDRPPKEHS